MTLTRRERLAARAQRLEDWADKREAKANAARATAAEIVDGIPFGQPILLGHHSQRRMERQRDRLVSNMDASIEHDAKAKDMRQRARHIEEAAERAIYSDDPDAIQRLQEKIAALEAERGIIKRYNRTVKNATQGDLSILTAELRQGLMSHRSAHATGFDPGWLYPSYALSNLSANINRLKKRLDGLKKSHPNM